MEEFLHHHWRNLEEFLRGNVFQYWGEDPKQSVTWREKNWRCPHVHARNSSVIVRPCAGRPFFQEKQEKQPFSLNKFLLLPEAARELGLELLAGFDPKGKSSKWQEEEFQAHYGSSSLMIANQWFDLCCSAKFEEGAHGRDNGWLNNYILTDIFAKFYL
jgi:hypothetical protein